MGHQLAPRCRATSSRARRYRVTEEGGGRYIASIWPTRWRLTRSTLAISVCVAPATVRRTRRSRPVGGLASAYAIASSNTDQMGHRAGGLQAANRLDLEGDV